MVHDVNNPLDYGLSHTQSDCNEIIGQSYIHIPYELLRSAEPVRFLIANSYAVGTLTSITDSYICSLQTIVSTQDLTLGLSTVNNATSIAWGVNFHPCFPEITFRFTSYELHEILLVELMLGNPHGWV